ncbi:hypothetical protein, partial [Klebsiella aerogenes]|uniref:hypothetical protein n=1 Tax=Klebsiella aerogenes TaxID=548 RepID=UPI0013D3E986
VVDTLAGGSADAADLGREVPPAAAVDPVGALHDAKALGGAIDDKRQVAPEGMPLHAELELLVAIVCQAHRATVAVQARHDDEVGEDRMVLGA